KTLEEPPSYVIFILATTEKHKIIPTILSRCQIYDFNRITIDDMIDHLSYVAGQEGITAERSALNIIARKADGAMRDALSIFDQVAASSRGNITYSSTVENLNVLDADYYSRLLDAFLSGNVADALLIYHEIRDHGFDAHFFIVGLADYFRDLMVARDPRTKSLLETSDEQREAMAAQAQRCQPQFLFRAMDLCNQADLNFRVASNKQFLVELTLIKLCQADGPSLNDSGEGEGQLKPIGNQPASAASQPQSGTIATAHPQPVTQRPAAAPKPATQVKAVPKPSVTTPTYEPAPKRQLTTLFVGVSSNRKPMADQASEPVASYNPMQARRSTPYTDVALDGAWQSYIAGHPEAHVLTHTMQRCRPRRLEPDVYLVMGESQIQMQ
ncbi:MAG: DNA polymerase III subunit gamma/tau, partial [Muribaculaceae bacterium]|nr:DNA polymerase III subunit gamma/tau [Muribaculaceae bacterium]